MNQFMSFLSNNKPGIIMGLGIGSMIMATASAFWYGPMARDALEEKREESENYEIPPIETVKTVAPYVIPSLCFTAIGVGCILGGNQINVNRGAAAMAAYAISDTAFREYREQTRRVVGEKKEKDIEEAVASRALEKSSHNGNVIWTTGGDYLCYDKLTNQYFRSSKNTVESIINQLNRDMFTSMVITEDEYCLALGIDTVELGNDLGWDINKNGLIDVSFTAKLTDNGEPCTVIVHRNNVRYLH